MDVICGGGNIKKPSFIISLDCESKWGMADHLNEFHTTHFSNAAIIEAYSRLLKSFQKWQIPATFAFVAGMTISPGEYKQYQDLFLDCVINGRNWLEAFRRDASNNAFEGWLVPEALDLVSQHDQHEIASHGFCHLPLGSHLVNENDAYHEIRAIKTVMDAKGHDVKTFVYPRNIVGYKEQLESCGFLGYREALKLPAGSIRPFVNLSLEFNLFSKAQKPFAYPKKNFIPIPSGYFFNWRMGLRRHVPAWITIQRWKNIINHAIKNNLIAHLWFHPHNLIDSPSTFTTLEQVLQYLAERRDLGEIDVITQLEYCNRNRMVDT